jgi:hypothetical protein
VDSRVGLDDVEKRKFSVVQHVASHYPGSLPVSMESHVECTSGIGWLMVSSENH